MNCLKLLRALKYEVNIALLSTAEEAIHFFSETKNILMIFKIKLLICVPERFQSLKLGKFTLFTIKTLKFWTNRS